MTNPMPCPCCGRPLPIDETLQIDAASGVVRRGGRFVILPRAEVTVLEILVAAQGRFVTKERVFTKLHGQESECNVSVVESHVSKLNRKLRTLGLAVKTTRYSGYRFIPPEGASI